jgi:hypothetical protein
MPLARDRLRCRDIRGCPSRVDVRNGVTAPRPIDESGVEGDQAGLGAEPCNIDSQLTFGALDDRPLDTLSQGVDAFQADETIVARAESEDRIVVTYDKDFGELAFRYGLPASCGGVLLRLSGSEPGSDNQRIVEALEGRSDWAGHFSVITDDRIHMRPLPAASPPPEAPCPTCWFIRPLARAVGSECIGCGGTPATVP